MQTYSTKPVSTFADVTTDVLAEDGTVVSPEAGVESWTVTKQFTTPFAAGFRAAMSGRLLSLPFEKRSCLTMPRWRRRSQERPRWSSAARPCCSGPLSVLTGTSGARCTETIFSAGSPVLEIAPQRQCGTLIGSGQRSFNPRKNED